MPAVAIIGAGPSGLAAAKAMMEHGISPVIYDCADNLGGMWGGPSRGAWSSYARTNLSYFSCGFSDFPWPDGTEVFPKRYRVIEYLRAYARAFGVNTQIQYHTIVRSVDPIGPHKWRVTTQCGDSVEARVFDHVIVATRCVFETAYSVF